MFKNQFWFHLLGILIVLIWGTTFVNSKVLLLYGLQAHEIFVIRFVLAYICIWFISPRKLLADSWRDELYFLVLGMTGGSLYFITENTAVRIDYVNNVSFIVCTAPLLTTILAILFIKDVKATRPLITGSILALVGVALVVFNGQFVLKLNPLGDLLASSAALCWAIYSIQMRSITRRYGSVFITRKVFFYGVLTSIPIFIVKPWHFPMSGFWAYPVWTNLVFLGIIASFACFALWTVVNKRIGALSASNYIYLNPISTVVASALFLDEPMTLIAYAGSALILLGVYVSNK